MHRIAKGATPKRKKQEGFQMDGSRINLTTKPTKFGAPMTFPMRRAASATPICGRDSFRRSDFNRPISAREFYRSSESLIGSACSDLCENVYQNILNDYNENGVGNSTTKSMEMSHRAMGKLQPQPLPSQVTDLRESLDATEAEDEIVDLKFRKWFPEASIALSSSTQPAEFSVREHRYQTCEYRYRLPQARTNSKGVDVGKEAGKEKKSSVLKQKPPLKSTEFTGGRKRGEGISSASKKNNREGIFHKNNDETEALVGDASNLRCNFRTRGDGGSRRRSPVKETVEREVFHNIIVEVPEEENFHEFTDSDEDEDSFVKNERFFAEEFAKTEGIPKRRNSRENLAGESSTIPEERAKTEKVQNSVFEEIADILKVLEKENFVEKEVSEMKATMEEESANSAKAIWSLLEEAEKNCEITPKNDNVPATAAHKDENKRTKTVAPASLRDENEPRSWNRMSNLLKLSSPDLAQKVMSLQMKLDEREASLESLNDKYRKLEHSSHQRRQEFQISSQKQLRLIEQLKNEKKASVEEYEAKLREMDKNRESSLQRLEEKYKVDMQKALEKQAANEKIQRERWIQAKTQKIKELAVKGLEPELNRMSSMHQEEISDIRRFHQRQLQELEETWSRRMAVLKEKMEADREKALAIEREMSRQKLADEISELEKGYQDKRKRLLAEVHVERERVERDVAATLAVKEKETEEKLLKREEETEKKMEMLRLKHQEELEKLRETLENEKQAWLKSRELEAAEKESKRREELKRELGKEAEAAALKLENEYNKREQNADQKWKKLKEQYEAEIKDLEKTAQALRKKVNDARVEMRKIEDVADDFGARNHQLQTEYSIVKEKYERLLAERDDMRDSAKAEIATKLNILQSELNQSRLMYESQLKTVKCENERQLSQMYARVKEMISKKDEVIACLRKEKEAALNQCGQMEKLLERRIGKQHSAK